jgi:hypothetical protein
MWNYPELVVDGDTELPDPELLVFLDLSKTRVVFGWNYDAVLNDPDAAWNRMANTILAAGPRGTRPFAGGCTQFSIVNISEYHDVPDAPPAAPKNIIPAITSLVCPIGSFTPELLSMFSTIDEIAFVGFFDRTLGLLPVDNPGYKMRELAKRIEAAVVSCSASISHISVAIARVSYDVFDSRAYFCVQYMAIAYAHRAEPQWSGLRSVLVEDEHAKHMTPGEYDRQAMHDLGSGFNTDLAFIMLKLPKPVIGVDELVLDDSWLSALAAKIFYKK